LTGAEAAEALEGLSKMVRARTQVSADELVTLLALALGAGSALVLPTRDQDAGGRPRGGMSNAEKCRRYRQKGRDTEPTPVATPPTPTPRPTPNGVATPPPTPKPTPPTPVATPFGPSPAPLPFRSGNDEDEKKNSSSSNPENRASDTGVATPKPTPVLVSGRRPRNLSAALELKIGERARLVLENPHDAQWLQPERWPELVQVAEAFAEANGDPRPRLLRFSSDAAVRHLCELFAGDYELEEILYVATAAPRQQWWNDGKRLGLTSLSAQVVSRTLAGRREAEAEQAKVDELVAKTALPMPVRSLLPSVGRPLPATKKIDPGAIRRELAAFDQTEPGKEALDANRR
jgi:hypothetical protein